VRQKRRKKGNYQGNLKLYDKKISCANPAAHRGFAAGFLSGDNVKGRSDPEGENSAGCHRERAICRRESPMMRLVA